jgi:hypothetical protein
MGSLAFAECVSLLLPFWDCLLLANRVSGFFKPTPIWNLKTWMRSCPIPSLTPDLTMTNPPSEYLAISRGHWDKKCSPEEIQQAIDAFYIWHARMVEEGKMKVGSRLGREAKLVTRERVIDGPFTEAKEVIGGYWFILAGSLEEAVELAAGNPCLACGLSYEVRPLEAERASASAVSAETPVE